MGFVLITNSVHNYVEARAAVGWVIIRVCLHLIIATRESNLQKFSLPDFRVIGEE